MNPKKNLEQQCGMINHFTKNVCHFWLKLVFCISSVCWHFCCSSNNECPDSACHMKTDTPVQTSRQFNVEITVMLLFWKQNNLKQFKPRCSLFVACIGFTDPLWFPLLCCLFPSLILNPIKMLWQSYQTQPVYTLKKRIIQLWWLKNQTATLSLCLFSIFFFFVCERTGINSKKNSIYRKLNKCGCNPADPFWGQPRSQHSVPCLSGLQRVFICC